LICIFKKMTSEKGCSLAAALFAVAEETGHNSTREAQG
jgi:hypothetical protein